MNPGFASYFGCYGTRQRERPVRCIRQGATPRSEIRSPEDGPPGRKGPAGVRGPGRSLGFAPRFEARPTAGLRELPPFEYRTAPPERRCLSTEQRRAWAGIVEPMLPPPAWEAWERESLEPRKLPDLWGRAHKSSGPRLCRRRSAAPSLGRLRRFRWAFSRIGAPQPRFRAAGAAKKPGALRLPVKPAAPWRQWPSHRLERVAVAPAPANWMLHARH